MTELTQTDNACTTCLEPGFNGKILCSRHHEASPATFSNRVLKSRLRHHTHQAAPAQSLAQRNGQMCNNIAACHLTKLSQFSFHHHHHYHHHHHHQCTVRLLTSTMICLTALMSLPTLRTRACLATLGVERLEGACVHRATTKHCDPSNLNR